MKAAGQLKERDMLLKHRRELLDRKEKMEAEGQRPVFIVAPGDTSPSEEPPEVDW